MATSAFQTIQNIKRGVPYREFTSLQRKLGVDQNTLAQAINISERTLLRRKNEGRFTRDESDRIHRISRVLARSQKIIGKNAGIAWMLEPKNVLAGHTPLQYSDTEIGALEIEHILGRIEHGIPY